MSTPRKLSDSPDAIRKRIKRGQDRIKRDNEQFAALSPAEKRVAIAKDVIAGLATKRLLAKKGTYVSAYVRSPANFDDEKADAQVALQAGIVQNCTVCALGGLFTCAVGRLNDISLYDFRYAEQEQMHEYLEPYFDNDQLYLIESAFEMRLFCDDDSPDMWSYSGWLSDDCADTVAGSPSERAIRFGRKYKAKPLYPDEDETLDPEVNYYDGPDEASSARMVAIMENIIANGGKFKP